ncbi:MAG: ATP-dependent zinc protease [Flavobacteriales bacterium]|nr:ATP-dependent zinc protease [Flavobacteriales bacterium]
MESAWTMPVRQRSGPTTFAPMAKARITIGRLEHIALPGLGVERVQAKVDTGAFRSALHYQKVRTRTVDGNKQLVVTFLMARKRVTMVFKRFQRVSVKSSNGETSRRWLISTRVKLNGHTVRTQFTLFDRSDMKHQVLLGRKFLRGRFVVDVALKNVLG